MQLPQIRMESQLAQIAIRQTAGKQEIRQPQADLSIQQPKAHLSIETIPAKLTMDQTQAWEDMNLMNIIRRFEKLAQKGYRDSLEGIGRRAEQGTELMKIENKGDPIIQQAIKNGYEAEKLIGLKYIPSPFSVNIHYNPYQIKLDVQINKPIIDVEVNKPEHHYRQGGVDVHMEKYQQLAIDFIHLFSEEI